MEIQKAKRCQLSAKNNPERELHVFQQSAAAEGATRWRGQDRRTGGRVDPDALYQWATKVDGELEEIQTTLQKQNTVLDSLQQALFATDDKGQHNQIGLMTTAKKLCGFVAVVKWVGTLVVGSAALVAAIKVFT
jgi:hypothetical protein